MYTQSAPLNPSVPHSHASSSRLGLQEIFDWAERMSGIPCKCLRDLQDGAIISSIMRKIFPIAAQNCALSGTVAIGSRYRDDHWSEVSAMTAYLQLPEHLLDYLGVASGSFESSYGVLVSFFFLHGLSQKHDFAVDFAHPIHPPLARFLESNRSVECLIRGGSLVGLQHGLPDAATPPAIGAPVPSSAHTPLPPRPLPLPALGRGAGGLHPAQEVLCTVRAESPTAPPGTTPPAHALPGVAAARGKGRAPSPPRRAARPLAREAAESAHLLCVWVCTGLPVSGECGPEWGGWRGARGR